MLVDTHCHLGHIEADDATTLAEARRAGVDVVVDIGMGTAESRAAVRRATEVPGVYAAVGIHPNDLGEFEADREATMDALRVLAKDPRVVAIGETGFDFYRDRSMPAVQEDALRAHIELAEHLDKTLVIHCRDAHARLLEVLDECTLPDRVVMHCFSGDVAFARECTDRRFYGSFAGNVTFPKADELRAAAAALPRDLLLVETDAPFLAPVPFRGKPNAPKLLPHTASALATVLDTSVDELTIALRGNSSRAFAVDLF